jgi:hypothetical protein
VRLSRTIELRVPAWAALAAGRWGGPVRVRAGEVEYAGKVALVDVDEDARVVGAHAQARRVGGWGGVAARLELRPQDERAVEISGEVTLSGEASEEAAEALLGGVAARLEDAATEPEPDRALVPGPRVAAGSGGEAEPREPSLADDPAYRRRLAARAAMAVAVGAAVGAVGAALGKRRS